MTGLEKTFTELERDDEYDTNITFRYDPKNYVLNIIIQTPDRTETVSMLEDEVIDLANWMYLIKKRLIG